MISSIRSFLEQTFASVSMVSAFSSRNKVALSRRQHWTFFHGRESQVFDTSPDFVHKLISSTRSLAHHRPSVRFRPHGLFAKIRLQQQLRLESNNYWRSACKSLAISAELKLAYCCTNVKCSACRIYSTLVLFNENSQCTILFLGGETSAKF